jgi:hypothetical protein
VLLEALERPAAQCLVHYRADTGSAR